MRQKPDSFACQYPCTYADWRDDVVSPVRGPMAFAGTPGTDELNRRAAWVDFSHFKPPGYTLGVTPTGAEQEQLELVRPMEVCYADSLQHKLLRALHSALFFESRVCLQRGGGALS